MRYIFFFFSAFVLYSCQETQYPVGLLKHTQVVNAGIEELIHERLLQLNIAASQTDLLQQPKRDAEFYEMNTDYLLEQKTKEPDSLIFWRLTQSMESRKYDFKPSLDSSIVFGRDTLMRKSALLFNLHEYIIHIFQSYSYCGITVGTIPVRDKKDSNIIYLHGTPLEASELEVLVRHTNDFTSPAADTLPVWGILILNPN